MKCRDLKYIEIKHDSLKPIKKNRDIKTNVGFDTETENGKCFLLGYWTKDSKKILETKDNYEYYNFLLHKGFRETNNFFYNVTYDFQAVIKGLPRNNLKDLAKWDKTIYEDIKIETLPNKMFSLTRKKKKTKFFDLSQFYNFNSLNNSATKFLNIPKENLKDSGIDIKSLSFERYKNDIFYKNKMREYLFRDCELTYKLANKLTKLVEPYIKPNKFYSQASFSEQYFLENLNHKINLPPKKVIQFALNSYQGGRFETIKRGYFEKSYIADIKSAYPFHNIEVPDVSRKIWKYNKEYEPDALVSIFKVNTETHNINISPLKYQLQSNLMIYPNGKFKDIYINKKEYELIIELGYKIKILDAVHYLDNEPEYPYKFLKKFYNLKEKFKHDNNKEMSIIPKIIINGFYGKTIQINPSLHFTKEFKGKDYLFDVMLHEGKEIYVYKYFKSGKIFNPVVANEITANTRVQLFNSVKKDLDKVIGFQTDSIITEKKINNIEYGNKLGDWEIEKQDEPLLILGSGVYQVLSENPKIRLRGFQKNMNLYNLLRDNKYKDSIKISLTRNMKLKQTQKLRLTDKQKDDMFNKILDVEKKININFDKKRIWQRPFKNCKDVLENQITSKPITI